MGRVTVYIETSSQIGRIKTGAYVYLMEYIKKNGEPFTREGHRAALDTTKDRLTLMAMIEALERITDQSAEIVFVPSDHGIMHIINNGWHRKWSENGWKTQKGDVANADLWKEYMELSRQRDITVTDEHNSYGNIMRKELKEVCK